MKILVFLLLSSFLVVSAVAQSVVPLVRTDYDLAKLTAPSTLSEDELTGRRLFVQRCYLCHDPLGQPTGRAPAPWLDQERVGVRGEDWTRDYILEGSRRMPGFQYQLETTQVNQIISFLKTVSPDDRPDTSERELFSPESSGSGSLQTGDR